MNETLILNTLGKDIEIKFNKIWEYFISFSFSFKTCCAVAFESEETLMVHYQLEAETFQQKRKFSRVWIGTNNVTRPSISSHVIVLTRVQNRGPLRHCEEHTVYLKVCGIEKFENLFR